MITSVNFDENIIADKNEVRGASEFNFWNIISGILVGGREFADEVNWAVNDAYKELAL